MSLFGMALPAACCDCRDDEIKKRGCMISPAAGTFGGAAAPASSSTELCGLGITFREDIAGVLHVHGMHGGIEAKITQFK